jgi:ribonuclease E
MGGGWDDLASQLGVVRPEQPDEPVQPESGRKQRDAEREWERPSTDTVREDEGDAKAPETVVTTSTWDETAGAEASSDSADVDSSSAVEEEQGSGKTKRRRRRRPAKKKNAGREAATADEPPSEGQPADAESTEDEKKAGATKEAPKQDEAAKPAGSAHRGIPNWQEAIEMIISKNMESRAKKPSGSQTSRSRAGSRGGRKTKSTSKKAV